MKKLRYKITACVLAVAVILSGTIIRAHTNQSQEVRRDIALIVNISSDSNTKANEDITQAASAFAAQLLDSADTETRVVAFPLDESVEAVFQTDPLTVQEGILDTPITDLSGINSSLSQADTLFRTDSRDDTEKSIVIISDGLWSGAEDSEGISTDLQDYSVYSVTYPGREESLSLLDEVQNEGLYTYTDEDSLTESLDQVYDELLPDEGYIDKTEADNNQEEGSREDNDSSIADAPGEPLAAATDGAALANAQGSNGIPIIFVPGLLSSRAFTDEDCDENSRVWDPIIWQGFNLKTIRNLFTNVGKHIGQDENGEFKTLYTRPIENQVTAKNREYGALDYAQNLIDRLCDEFPDREIYFFSYDFRQNSEYAALELADFIDNVLQVDKVDAIGHSAGGNVLATLTSLGYGDRLNTVISVGAPFEGAPRIADASVNAAITGTKIADIFLEIKGLKKEVKTTFPSVAESFPSAAYTEAVPFFYKYHSWQFKRLASTEDINRIASTVYGEENFYEGRRLYKQSLVNGVTSLATLDKSYFLISDNKRTISGVAFKEGASMERTKVYGLGYTAKGDGTVPYLSATNMSKLSTFVGEERIAYFSKIQHTDLVQKNEPINWIIDVLKSDGTYKDYSTPNAAEPYVIITIENSEEVTISNDSVQLSTTEDMETEFGSLYVLGEDVEIQSIDLDDEEEYSIRLQGALDDTVNYTITWYDENDNEMDSRTIENIPVTEDTVIKTNAKKEETVLQVDTDGSGAVDTLISVESNETVQAEERSEKAVGTFFKAVVQLFEDNKK